jgi:hypothetical protein
MMRRGEIRRFMREADRERGAALLFSALRHPGNAYCVFITPTTSAHVDAAFRREPFCSQKSIKGFLYERFWIGSKVLRPMGGLWQRLCRTFYKQNPRRLPSGIAHITPSPNGVPWTFPRVPGIHPLRYCRQLPTEYADEFLSEGGLESSSDRL